MLLRSHAAGCWRRPASIRAPAVRGGRRSARSRRPEFEAAAPGVKIEQYGLRGVGGETVMEFAISGVTGEETADLSNILNALNESEVVGVVRQVSEKHQSFSE